PARRRLPHAAEGPVRPEVQTVTDRASGRFGGRTSRSVETVQQPLAETLVDAALARESGLDRLAHAQVRAPVDGVKPVARDTVDGGLLRRRQLERAGERGRD